MTPSTITEPLCDAFVDHGKKYCKERERERERERDLFAAFSRNMSKPQIAKRPQQNQIVLNTVGFRCFKRYESQRTQCKLCRDKVGELLTL